MQGSQGPVDVREACPILEAWNLRDDLDSRGAVLFRRFATKLLALPGPLGSVASNPAAYEQPFDVNDPVNTPRGLSNNQSTRTALARRGQGAARQRHPAQRPPARVPVRGARQRADPDPRRPGHARRVQRDQRPVRGPRGLPGRDHGLELRDGRASQRHALPGVALDPHLLAVGQPGSRRTTPTRRGMYSQKKWVDMRFCTEEVLRDRALRVTELGCVSDSGLRSARVRGARRGRVRFAFKRRFRVPVTVEVRRARVGRLGPPRAAGAPGASVHAQAPAARRALRGPLHRPRAHGQGRPPRGGLHGGAPRRRSPSARLAPRLLPARALRHAALGHAAARPYSAAGRSPLRFAIKLAPPRPGVGVAAARQAGSRAAAHPSPLARAREATHSGRAGCRAACTGCAWWSGPAASARSQCWPRGGSSASAHVDVRLARQAVGVEPRDEVACGHRSPTVASPGSGPSATASPRTIRPASPGRPASRRRGAWPGGRRRGRGPAARGRGGARR